MVSPWLMPTALVLGQWPQPSGGTAFWQAKWQEGEWVFRQRSQSFNLIPANFKLGDLGPLLPSAARVMSAAPQGGGEG